MYLGAILMFFGAPLMLGSLYGLLAGFTLTLLLMARILGEEAMLARDLEGYREYMQEGPLAAFSVSLVEEIVKKAQFFLLHC